MSKKKSICNTDLSKGLKFECQNPPSRIENIYVDRNGNVYLDKELKHKIGKIKGFSDIKMDSKSFNGTVEIEYINKTKS